MQEISETLRATFRRVTRRENRRTNIRPGRLEHIPGFASAIFGNSREITVYLPPGYDDRDDRRYPVLYMQDGQNVFDAHRAFIPGQHWRMQEAADAAIGSRTASPMIIVAVDNAGVGRIDEYTPTREEKHKGGGRANDYGRMLVEEVKPMIDGRFRTIAEDNAIGGSSLGGLLSLHLVLARRDVFWRAAVMSPSVWWGGRTVLQTVESFDGPPPRLWLDIGGREGNQALQDARTLRNVINAKHWPPETFRYYEDRRGDHSERAWARRVRMALEFLFPPA
ncbi:MAG TPA: alpha/beta hydrolase-fold protein [Thermoanaerobaculia bacterium]|nr:alpha/beta hydrolase-fold protein [Thermoanaerobaculia bacterium]